MYSQMEKSEARQYLQLAQYYASFNRGAMPVLPVNTVPNIGMVLAYYWHGIFWQYWWNSEVGVSLAVATLLVYHGGQYWLLLPVPADSTGPVLFLSTSRVIIMGVASTAPVPVVRRRYWRGTAPVVNFHIFTEICFSSFKILSTYKISLPINQFFS